MHIYDSKVFLKVLIEIVFINADSSSNNIGNVIDGRLLPS